MASTGVARPSTRMASASPPGLAAHCAELMAPLGSVRVRRMFGGHGLYLDELFIAIVTGETLYLKTDAMTADHFRAAGGRPFQYEGAGRAVTVAYWTVPEAALDSPDGLRPWARLALEAALRARAAAAPKQPAPKRPAAAGRKRTKAQAAR